MTTERRTEIVETMARAIWSRERRRWLEAVANDGAKQAVNDAMPPWHELGESKRLELRQNADAAFGAYESFQEMRGQKIAQSIMRD